MPSLTAIIPRGTGGEWHASFKTLRNPDEVSIFIDGYLSGLKRMEVNGQVVYYDAEQDITIGGCHCNNDGIAMINTVYQNYVEGKAAKAIDLS